jgi:hypothetical protein
MGKKGKRLKTIKGRCPPNASANMSRRASRSRFSRFSRASHSFIRNGSMQVMTLRWRLQRRDQAITRTCTDNRPQPDLGRRDGDNSETMGANNDWTGREACVIMTICACCAKSDNLPRMMRGSANTTYINPPPRATRRRKGDHLESSNFSEAINQSSTSSSTQQNTYHTP